VAPGAPQVATYTPSARKKGKIGYALSQVGGALTFLSGIAYAALGNAVVGILGITFGILIVVFARRTYSAAEVRKVGLPGIIPFVIGWFMLIASGTLISFDIGVSIAGFLTVVGSLMMFAGKQAPERGMVAQDLPLLPDTQDRWEELATATIQRPSLCQRQLSAPRQGHIRDGSERVQVADHHFTL
jgi:hypothetical protein